MDCQALNNKQQWPLESERNPTLSMRNVDQTFCPMLLSAKQTFDLLFSHFWYIKS
jgi:hypothetical protein